MNQSNIQNNAIDMKVAEILMRIKTGELTMKPRVMFSLKLGIFALLILSIFVTSIFLCSLILFSLQASGKMILLGFGYRGILMFALLFPWTLLVVDVLLVIALGFLLRHFRFGYRSPLVYLVTSVCILMMSVGFLVERQTHLHQEILNRSSHNEIPIPLNSFYDDVRNKGHVNGVCRCEVLAVAGSSTIVVREDPSDSDMAIATSSDLQKDAANTQFKVSLPLGQLSDSIRVGDILFIAGDVDEDGMKAFGISKADPRR